MYTSNEYVYEQTSSDECVVLVVRVDTSMLLTVLFSVTQILRSPLGPWVGVGVPWLGSETHLPLP